MYFFSLFLHYYHIFTFLTRKPLKTALANMLIWLSSSVNNNCSFQTGRVLKRILILYMKFESWPVSRFQSQMIEHDTNWSNICVGSFTAVQAWVGYPKKATEKAIGEHLHWSRVPAYLENISTWLFLWYRIACADWTHSSLKSYKHFASILSPSNIHTHTKKIYCFQFFLIF